MKYNVITIENKKYILLPNEEYLSMTKDIEDLKKVFSRRNETSIEAKMFFSTIKKNKRSVKNKLSQ